MSGFIDDAFAFGDSVLDNGGQTALNMASMGCNALEPIPVVGEAAMLGNVVVNGGQYMYHGAHAVNDFANGNNREGVSQLTEAGYHALMAVPGMGQGLGGLVEGGVSSWDFVANALNLGGAPTQPGITTNGHGRVASAPAIAGNMISELFGITDANPPAHH